MQAEEQLFLGEAYKKIDLVFARPDGVTSITPHDLRDTHASLLAKAGVPIEVISSRLGHSCISITVDRYLTVYQERDAAAAAAFERLVAYLGWWHNQNERRRDKNVTNRLFHTRSRAGNPHSVKTFDLAPAGFEV